MRALESQFLKAKLLNNIVCPPAAVTDSIDGYLGVLFAINFILWFKMHCKMNLNNTNYIKK